MGMEIQYAMSRRSTRRSTLKSGIATLTSAGILTSGLTTVAAEEVNGTQTGDVVEQSVDEYDASDVANTSQTWPVFIDYAGGLSPDELRTVASPAIEQGNLYSFSADHDTDLAAKVGIVDFSGDSTVFIASELWDNGSYPMVSSYSIPEESAAVGIRNVSEETIYGTTRVNETER
ncbi:hypothetical protein [Halobiforma nitratireducens]|uniref:Uncharacterized protein n=1 Tax=Halobiforma nitratireducens JCM 10879 TaxID=1227454 RepID=M0MRR1_9EURY|nr:hypothetical protein [Halobiforma nitratireducens]EMA47145.1 hypothetical protein C446_00480 [Halobiforma nitratireducens JCM 10879]